MASKQQTFISPSSGGWEVQIKVLEDLLFRENQFSGSRGAIFSMCPHIAEGVKELLGGLFYKATNPIHEGSILTTQSSPRSLLLNTIPLGIRTYQMNFGGTQTFGL